MPPQPDPGNPTDTVDGFSVGVRLVGWRQLVPGDPDPVLELTAQIPLDSYRVAPLMVDAIAREADARHQLGTVPEPYAPLEADRLDVSALRRDHQAPPPS